MSRVTVVIPTWNRCDLLIHLLKHLPQQSRPIERILVVDNGSSDGAPEAAEAAGADVIRLDYNSGFAAAVNRGIRASQTEWVAVLNNDVELHPQWLDQLLRAAEASGAWFATGKLLCSEDPAILDGAFDTLSRGGCAWRAGHSRQDGPVWNQSRTVFFVPFTAALFRRDLFEKVGELDERFESYLEDVEFGVRCAVQGYAGVYVPKAVAYHQGSATLGLWHPDTVRRIARNQVLLVAKHYPKRWLIRLGWPVLVGQLLWGGVAVRHGAGSAYLRGKISGWKEWRRFRQDRAQTARLAEILKDSEHEIRALQERTGFELYWRLYFFLT